MILSKLVELYNGANYKLGFVEFFLLLDIIIIIIFGIFVYHTNF